MKLFLPITEEMLAKVDSLRKSNKEVVRERRMVNHQFSQISTISIFI